MFERLRRVIREKNKVQKERKRRRNKDIIEMRNNSIFSAKLSRDLNIIGILLMDSDIDSIEVETSQENVPRLDSAMYGYEMAEYVVSKDDTRYTIRNKDITL
jgi:hypothetical protein